MLGAPKDEDAGSYCPLTPNREPNRTCNRSRSPTPRFVTGANRMPCRASDLGLTVAAKAAIPCPDQDTGNKHGRPLATGNKRDPVPPAGAPPLLQNMDRRLSTLGAFTMQRFQSSSVAMNDLQGQVDNLLERVAQLENEKIALQDQDEQMKTRIQELHNSWVAWSETIIDSIHKEENRAQIVENDMFTLRVSLSTIRLWIDNPNVDATRDMAALRSALGSVRLWADMRPATARRPLAAEA